MSLCILWLNRLARRALTWLPLLAVSVVLNGCTSGTSVSDEDARAVNDFIASTKVAKNIQPITDSDLLLSILREGMSRQSRVMQIEFQEAVMATDSATANSTASSSTSRTNVQVAGVDEADRMKSDGQRLYAIRTDRSYQKQNQLRVFNLKSGPTSEHLADVSVGQIDDPTLSGLYLLDNQRVVLLYGGNQFQYFEFWWDSWSWQQRTNVVEVVDLSDPTNPVTEARLVIDGSQVTTRKIGNHLYLLNRYTPNIDQFEPHPYSDQKKAENQQLLASIDLADLLPKINTGDTDEPLVTASSCYLPPIEDADKLSADVIALVDINLDQISGWQSRCIVGATETMFVTANAAYLATSRYDYDAGTGDVVYDANMVTDIHKFSLTEAGPEYRGSGQVIGQLGWDNKKKPFRFGEYNGMLAVITSEGSTWDASSSTRLTILKEGVGNELEQLATLPGLGKPGESLYAARFLDRYAYLVTFKNTDPLYVIDISDPNNLVVGELDVPGYSEYLHPLSGGYLLGVGKDAVDATDNRDGLFAWYQGVKIALYDVRDAANPVELVNKVIGKRGTVSTANVDHHGVVWLPADATKGRLARLALPVQLHNEPVTTSYDWDSADWTQTGLKMFEIDDGSVSGKVAIAEKAELVVERNSGGQSYPVTGVYQDRGVIVGDLVYYLHGDQLWSGNWASSNIADGPIPAQ
ncbi:hypothetical protein CYQ88_06625 [Hydrogenovibrio sp. SC-1]|uniref:beta-propeller domain-containing protein n=1 Tax=Hydrogenovibrio sp. SC-1 TaxID=2065820 RepID=UPI000C7E776B|nr:beta-propeller domain-containing protein [Hydrogenovibrio sp. SC-1]PLA74357.1 hypothetical protein CYQ88_06625 [Hydrogenovibrio sp. SC-1]